MEGGFAGIISCFRHHLAKRLEGLLVLSLSNLVAIQMRQQGGAFRQCRIARQQFRHESDGAASCSHPGTRPPGVIACTHSTRPLLGLVTYRLDRITNVHAVATVPNSSSTLIEGWFQPVTVVRTSLAHVGVEFETPPYPGTLHGPQQKPPPWRRRKGPTTK